MVARSEPLPYEVVILIFYYHLFCKITGLQLSRYGIFLWYIWSKCYHSLFIMEVNFHQLVLGIKQAEKKPTLWWMFCEIPLIIHHCLVSYRASYFRMLNSLSHTSPVLLVCVFTVSSPCDYDRKETVCVENKRDNF